MKKCSSCGATYNDSTNFCSSCGTRLTAVSAQRSRHPGHKKKQHRLIGRLAVPLSFLFLFYPPFLFSSIERSISL
ncbi:MAG: zinc-ribbon domain-containing protein [Coprococcus sp.]